MKVTGDRLQVPVGKIIIFLLMLFIFLYPIPYTLYPTHAACDLKASPVKIGDCFGFGDITSLGQGTSRLVAPMFSLAAVLVILYFLFGALKYLRAGGNKEEVEGARQMIEHSIFGFILLMFAFLVLQFLLYSLFKIEGFQIIK